MIRSFRIPLIAIALTLAAPLCLRADTPLGEKMDVMGKAMKALGTALKSPVDASKDKYIRLADDFHAAAVAARKLEPEKTTHIPEADRAKFLAEYHKGMDHLISETDKLKAELAAGKWDAARKQLQLMGDTRKAGHKEFRLKKN